MSVEKTLHKCSPLKCKTFFRLFDKFYDRLPVDRFVVNCPYRAKSMVCGNDKENLSVTLIPTIKIELPTQQEILAMQQLPVQLASYFAKYGVKP
ncbi:MAG: hypothetical protein WC365_10025 [Candidatus Babeliales bacterium]